MTIVKQRLDHCRSCGTHYQGAESAGSWCPLCTDRMPAWWEEFSEVELDDWINHEWGDEVSEDEDRAMVVGGRAWRDPS